MAIKLYKKLLLANSIYYGHNYINCMEYESDDSSLKNCVYNNKFFTDSILENYEYNESNTNSFLKNYVNNEFDTNPFFKNYMDEKSYDEKESIDNGEQYFIVNKNDNIRIQKKLKYFNITKKKKRGRIKKCYKNKLLGRKVKHDKFEKKNIIDKIIRKYKCFLQLHLNSILKELKFKDLFLQFKNISGKNFDVFKEFLGSYVVETIAEESKRCKNKRNKSLCKRIMKEEDKRFDEIKEILRKTNKEVYQKIFLGNHVVKLENEKKISYKSILDSIKDEYGDEYREEFEYYAKDLINTIDDITTRISRKNKTQIKYVDYIEINSDYNKNEGLGKKLEDISNLNQIVHKKIDRRKKLDNNNLKLDKNNIEVDGVKYRKVIIPGDGNCLLYCFIKINNKDNFECEYTAYGAFATEQLKNAANDLRSELKKRLEDLINSKEDLKMGNNDLEQLKKELAKNRCFLSTDALRIISKHYDKEILLRICLKDVKTKKEYIHYKKFTTDCNVEDINADYFNNSNSWKISYRVSLNGEKACPDGHYEVLEKVK